MMHAEAPSDLERLPCLSGFTHPLFARDWGEQTNLGNLAYPTGVDLPR